jgi:regulator of protease activity HflC (stomatin/prohibitin superfamily)
MKFHRSERGQAWPWVAGVLAFFALLTILLSVYTVPAGSVAVVTHFGAAVRVSQPGLNWKIPFVEGRTNMSIRTQKDEVDAGAASKDLQQVTSTIAVNYHLDGVHAMDVYKTLGTKYQDIVISPATQNVFKSITAQYTAEELITKRNEVRLAAEKALGDQLAPYYVIVDNFNITNFDFSQEFNQAIEAKQVANQAVETAKQKLAQAEVDAETAKAAAAGVANAAIESARGQSESIRLVAAADADAMKIKGQAIKDFPEMLQLQFFDTLKTANWSLIPYSSVQGYLPLNPGGTTVTK